MTTLFGPAFDTDDRINNTNKKDPDLFTKRQLCVNRLAKLWAGVSQKFFMHVLMSILATC